jgi:hypothetical protein
MNKQDFDLLTFFQNYSDRDDFIRIFGGAGDYLWRKFRTEGFNLLAFYSILSDNNKKRLVRAMNKAEMDYYLFNPQAEMPFENFVEQNI